MLTKDKDSVQSNMNQIVSNLELEKYSNNIKEHNENLSKFLKSFYKNIEVKELSNKKGETQFELSYENKKLYGVLNYL